MKTTSDLISGIQLATRCLSLALVLVLTGCGGGADEGASSNSVTGVADSGLAHDVGGGDVVDDVDGDADGVATLFWVAPSTRVDNTPLPMSEISGYKVYMGTSLGALTLYSDINDAYQMRLVVANLAEGTYYFAVTTYNQNGAESDFSTIISKTI